MTNPYPGPRNNTPTIAALGAMVMLVALVLGAIVILTLGKGLDSTATPLLVSMIAVVVTAVPALIGAAFAERASKDIRNGTLVAKTKEGAAQAIVEHAPVAVAQALDTAQSAELLALTKILAAIDAGNKPAPSVPTEVHVEVTETAGKKADQA